MKFGSVVLGASLTCLSATSLASDYGCRVLICLANPNGPKAVAECVPPINRLYRDLARGRSFPTCDLASAPNSPAGPSWAQRGHSYYDPCPEGTSALTSYAYAVQGSATVIYTGIGEGDGLTPGTGDSDSPLPGKVCVGQKIGETVLSTGNAEDVTSVTASIYDRVLMLNPASSPNSIDVYVNSTLYRRVRW